MAEKWYSIVVTNSRITVSMNPSTHTTDAAGIRQFVTELTFAATKAEEVILPVTIHPNQLSELLSRPTPPLPRDAVYPLWKAAKRREAEQAAEPMPPHE